MKIIWLYMVLVISCVSKSRLETDVHHLMIINYNDFGEAIDTTYKSINQKSALDIYFYRAHFYTPYQFPDTCYNPRYADTSIIIWSDPKSNDIHSSWNYTTYYDSSSCAISYSYSGCLICSLMPFVMKINYDTAHRPISLFKYHGINIEFAQSGRNVLNENVAIEEIYAKYEASGNILEMSCFSYGKLKQVIKSL